MNTQQKKMFVKTFLMKCLICRQSIPRDVCSNTKLYISTTAIKLLNDKFENYFSETEKDKILKIINNCELDTLSRYKITKLRAEEIVQQRQKNGNFKSLSEIENITSFTERTAKIFFNSIVNLDQSGSGEKKQKIEKSVGKLLYPPLTHAIEKNASSIAALYVKPTNVSWSVIDPVKYELLHWGTHDITEMTMKRPQLADIINSAWSTAELIPCCSFYVMESPVTTLRAGGSDPNNPKVISVNLQKEQLVAGLVSFLTARNRLNSESDAEQELIPAVYYLKAALASRLFRTLIGSERVSAESTIRSMFTSWSRVKIPANKKDFFLSQRDIEKEALGQCLLINLAFMEICYYKNPESLAKLKIR